MTCQYLTRDVDAFVDRELDAQAEAAVRLHLSGCAECRARVSDRETLSRVIRQLPYYEAPARVRATVATAARRTQSGRFLVAFAAAALVIVAAGGGAAVLLRAGLRHDDTGALTAVVDAHLRSLAGDHLYDVRSTDQHTVKPWFAGKLDFSPPVSDLASIGYPLAGGRIDYLDGHPAAALVYQRRQHVINVFIAPAVEGPAAGSGATSIRGLHVRQWTTGGMAFWAISDLADDELDRFVAALK